MSCPKKFSGIQKLINRCAFNEYPFVVVFVAGFAQKDKRLMCPHCREENGVDSYDGMGPGECICSKPEITSLAYNSCETHPPLDGWVYQVILCEDGGIHIYYEKLESVTVDVFDEKFTTLQTSEPQIPQIDLREDRSDQEIPEGLLEAIVKTMDLNYAHQTFEMVHQRDMSYFSLCPFLDKVKGNDVVANIVLDFSR